MDYNNPNAINNIPEHGSTRGNTCTETQPLLEKPPQSVILDFRQWQEGACGAFRPSAKTIPALPSGVYTPEMDQYGPFLLRKNIAADDLLELPDSVNASVLAAMGRFWASRDRYVKHGLLYKRGLLLWGPPGSGKTATVQLVIAQLLKQGGIVVLADNPRLLEILLAPIRQIEPARNLIVVLEDIDEIINSHGEKSLLSLLDGEAQVDNIVYLATTNYPDRLGARIVNRPSRFDERIFVGMPSAVARRSYLDRVAGEKFGLPRETVGKWCADTEGLSIAHLRELIAAVLCLDQQYDEVLGRLRSMSRAPKTIEGFDNEEIGFNKPKRANGGLFPAVGQ